MKKLISTLLVAFLLLSMVACGGENPKLATTIDTFNSISDQFNEVADLINENEDAIDDELIDSLNELADVLNEYADALEDGETLGDATLDAMLSWFELADDTLVEVKTAVEAVLSAEEESGTFPAALNDIDAYEIPELSYTGWQLAGGMIDGYEMEQEELDAILAACGGNFIFVFDAPYAVRMINGETAFDGTYEVILDNSALYMEFDGYRYYGVFTVVNDTVVMIIANPEVPGTALYMVAIDEH